MWRAFFALTLGSLTRIYGFSTHGNGGAEGSMVTKAWTQYQHHVRPAKLTWTQPP